MGAQKKVFPIGGEHKSASSLLAECMDDPQTKRVVVFSFDGQGSMSFAHFGVTRMEMAYAAAIAAKQAAEGDWDE
jgi:hypothetical protein